jgi:hypothetical protein
MMKRARIWIFIVPTMICLVCFTLCLMLMKGMAFAEKAISAMEKMTDDQ